MFINTGSFSATLIQNQLQIYKNYCYWTNILRKFEEMKQLHCEQQRRKTGDNQIKVGRQVTIKYFSSKLTMTQYDVLSFLSATAFILFLRPSVRLSVRMSVRPYPRLSAGNRWNILGFNFTKRDALSSVY